MYFQVTGQFRWLLHLTLAMENGLPMHCLAPYVGLIAGTMRDDILFLHPGKRLHEHLYPLY